MKTLYSIIAMVFITGAAVGQSQRFILAEEFTQASCGPCANQNPAFNALLDANQTKIIGLKYQVWWPGYDPMYNHNRSEVNTRVAYYGVQGVPDAYGDGNALIGSPNVFTQTWINNRFSNVSSPFTITANHSFNANFSQITINADINCTQATSGNLVAHVVVMEREINFASAPGTNGETEFYGVMKKMVPDDQGSAVTAVTAGASQGLNFTIDIPWYVYDLNQLAVVVFIQDVSTQAVHQTAYSAPLGGVVVNDVAVTTVTGVPSLICVGTFSPVVTIKNNSSSTLTSCNVNYQVDGGAIVSTPWTGSLALNGTSTITLNNISAGNGAHILRVFTSDLNTGVDYSPVNNNSFKNFAYSITAVTPPLVEGFVPATFPPTDWVLNDLNADNATWSRYANAGGFGTSTESARMDFWSSASGRIDEMIVKKVDLSGISGTAAISFDVAYRQYGAENDRLEVQVSTNCGVSWVSVFNKAGNQLTTVPGGQTTFFVPTAAQWRNENVDITSYMGQAEVLIKFKATSNYGNNMYVDNINVTVVTGINEAELEQAVNLYPSITSNLVNLDVNLSKTEDLKVVVLNGLGQEVVVNRYNDTLGGNFQIDLSELANGQYVVRIMTDSAVVTKQVTVAK